MADPATNGRVDDRTDQPVGELVKELTEQTSKLIRQELALARAEMTEKGRSAGVGVGMFGLASVLGWFALGALTAAAILALATAMAAWLAALVVAGIYLLVAGVLALRGRSQLEDATPPVPDEAVESVRKDAEAVKRSAKEGRR